MTTATQRMIRANVERSIETHRRLLRACLDAVSAGADALIQAYRAGHKALFFGNAGRAADAQHLTAEFLGRTFDQLFARKWKRLSVRGDVAVRYQHLWELAKSFDAVRCAR